MEIITDYTHVHLGVVINNTQCFKKGNTFKKHDYTYIADKANRARFGVWRKCKAVGHLTPKIGMYCVLAHRDTRIYK